MKKIMIFVVLMTITCLYATAQNAQNCPDTTVIVSDTTTQVDGHDSVIINPTQWTPPWTTAITGANWIWYQDQSQNDPLTTTTKTFTKTFNIAWPIDTATLKITADNGFRVYINGVLVDDTTYVTTIGGTDGQYFKNAYNYDITAKLQAGNNQITVDGVNLGVAGTTPLSNPGAIIYKIEITNDCDYEPPQLPEFTSTAMIALILFATPVTAYVIAKKK